MYNPNLQKYYSGPGLPFCSILTKLRAVKNLKTGTSHLTWFHLCCLCLSRAYYAIDTMQDVFETKSQNTRRWMNGGIINPLFDGLTYIRADMHLLIARIFPRPYGARKNTTQLAKYPRVLYV